MTKRKPYQQPIKATWWMANPFFVRYIIREGSSVFVAAFSLEVFYAMYALGLGEQQWLGFLNWLSSPLAAVFHILCFIAVLIHAFTWFSLAPKTMDIWIKNKKVDDKLITTGHYVGFVLVSFFIIILIGAWI